MECPEFERWSAFADGAAEIKPGEGLREHLADCGPCRETWGWLEGMRNGVREEPGLQEAAPCPSGERLGRYAQGSASSSIARTIRAHLETCVSCRNDVERVRGDLPETENVVRGGFSFRRLRWAAAVLLVSGLVVGSTVWFRGGSEVSFSPSSGPVSAQWIPGRSWHADEEMRMTAGSGVSLVLSPGTFLRARQDMGGRIPFRLEQGEVRVSVAGGSRRVEVEVPGGTLRDIGTEFTARIWETRPPWREADAPPVRLTAVETFHGVVELSVPGRRVESDPKRRGYLTEEGDLFLGSAGGKPSVENLLEQLRSAAAAVRLGREGSAIRIWAGLLEAARGRQGELMEMAEKRDLTVAESAWIKRLVLETGRAK